LVSAQESEETEMMGLPDGGKRFKIGLAVLKQYRHASDSQPRCRIASTCYAYLRRAVKMYKDILNRTKKTKVE